MLADQPELDFAISQGRKQKVVDGLWKGLQGLMKSRKITTVIGTGTLGPDHLVRVDDGTELVVGPGDLFSVPAGHDSWVIGEEPYVSIHLLGAGSYAGGGKTQ